MTAQQQADGITGPVKTEEAQQSSNSTAIPTLQATATTVPTTSSACPSATPRSNPESFPITITLAYADGRPAGVFYPDGPSKLDITVDGLFFVGAVQLKVPGNCTHPVLDLIPPVNCITKNDTSCEFLEAKPATSSKESHGTFSKREPLNYTIPLIYGDLPGLDNNRYVIQVAWSNVQNFSTAEQADMIRYSTADDTKDLNKEMSFVGAPTSIADPRLEPSAESSSTRASTATAETSPTATATPPSGSRDDGLTSGAKAGIAVGAVVGVLAIIALIFFLFRRRKSKRAAAGGYYGNGRGSSNDIREKEAGVGIAALPVSASPTSERGAPAGDAALIGRGNSARVVDGSHIENGDRVGRHATTGHTAPSAAAGGLARKPVETRVVSGEEIEGREGALSSQSQVLSEEERLRWEEEERRLDEDIAQAEARGLA